VRDAILLAALVFAATVAVDFASARYWRAMSMRRWHVAATWSMAQGAAASVGFIAAVKVNLWFIFVELAGLYVGTILGARGRISEASLPRESLPSQVPARSGEDRDPPQGEASPALPTPEPVIDIPDPAKSEDTIRILLRRRNVPHHSSLRPGEYMQVLKTFVHGSRVCAILRCPMCGELSSVGRLEHDVDHEGCIYPMNVCPHAPCKFSNWVQLENWIPEAKGKA